MAENSSGKSLLMPLMAGMLGAGLALLFAPRSGRETRQRMRMKADRMKDQAESSVTDIRDSLDRSIKEAQDLKTRLSAAMSNTGRKAKQEMKELRDDAERATPTQSSVLSTWEEEV